VAKEERMPELKPCPFCGDKDPLVEADEVDDGMSVVRCIGVRCGIRVGFFMSEDEAITAWNTRADEVRVRKETIEECITIISQNTPMEGCAGCETRLYEKLRTLTPDSGKVIDATVYYSGKYGAHKPVVGLAGQESLKTADELDLFLSEILGCNDPRATFTDRKQPLLESSYFVPIDGQV